MGVSRRSPLALGGGGGGIVRRIASPQAPTLSSRRTTSQIVILSLFYTNPAVYLYILYSVRCDAPACRAARRARRARETGCRRSAWNRQPAAFVSRGLLLLRSRCHAPESAASKGRSCM